MARTNSAASNVVALPTAAPRKVNNYRYAEQRRAVMEAREESPFADVYQPHYDRAADRLAAEVSAIEQTPALLIVSAMLRALDPAAVTKVLEQLAPGAVAGRPAHCQAVATVKASTLNLGQQFDLLRALDRLRQGGR